MRTNFNCPAVGIRTQQADYAAGYNEANGQTYGHLARAFYSIPRASYETSLPTALKVPPEKVGRFHIASHRTESKHPPGHAGWMDGQVKKRGRCTYEPGQCNDDEILSCTFNGRTGEVHFCSMHIKAAVRLTGQYETSPCRLSKCSRIFIQKDYASPSIPPIPPSLCDGSNPLRRERIATKLDETDLGIEGRGRNTGKYTDTNNITNP